LIVKKIRLDGDTSFQYIIQITETVKKVGRVLTLLWHPNSIIKPDWWDLYLTTLDKLYNRKFSRRFAQMNTDRFKYREQIIPVFYLIFSLIGLKVEAEVKTNKGRIDAVIIDKEIYIFEFKFNGNKNKALSQIKEKKYFEKYKNTGKEIYLFGVEFADRNVGEWVVEKMRT
jgi:hypothetical protein